MNTLADAMQKIPNPGDKLRILKNLKLDPKLLNSLEGGSEALKAAAAEAERFGQTLSQKNAAEIENFGDKFQDLQTSVSGFATQITAMLSPAFSYMSEVAANAFNDLREYLLGNQTSIEEWGAYLKAGLQNIGTLWEIFRDTAALAFVGIYDDFVSVFARLNNEMDRVAAKLGLKLVLMWKVAKKEISQEQADMALAITGAAIDTAINSKNKKDDQPSEIAKALADRIAENNTKFEKDFNADFAKNMAERPENKPRELPDGADAPDAKDKKNSGSASLNLNEHGSQEAYETIAKAGNMRAEIEQKQLDVLDDIDDELVALNTTINTWGTA